MKQWFISHIFIFCMFSHRILFYKSPFQWDWVHSSCSELPAQETGYPNMVGTFMLSFVFPPDIFKHFFKSKVGVFLVKRAQLKKKKKRWRLFFHFNRVDKNYQIFMQTHPQCTFLLFTTGVNEMRTYHYSQESYRKKKSYTWQYTLDYA